MPRLRRWNETSPRLKFKTTSFHQGFIIQSRQVLPGSSLRCKILQVGNDAVIDGEEQTAALKPLQDPYWEEGAFAKQHPEGRLLRSRVLKVAGKIFTDYSELI